MDVNHLLRAKTEACHRLRVMGEARVNENPKENVSVMDNFALYDVCKVERQHLNTK